MLTVDTPVPGARLRDVRNGLTIPPSLSLRTFAEGALHPAWWFDLLTTEALEFASLNRFDGTVAELVGRMFDPSRTMADLSWLRSVVARAAGGQGHPDTSTTRGPSSMPARTRSSSPTTAAASSTGRPTPLEALPGGGRRGRRPGRGVRRRRHPVRQRHRRRGRARRAGGPGRPRVPLRPDGRRRARRATGRRHPAGGGRHAPWPCWASRGSRTSCRDHVRLRGA